MVGLIVLYVVVTLTGVMRVFKIPTTSSRPALEPDDRIVVSTLVSPERYDLIVFRIFDSLLMDRTHYVFRLCGMPGDTVQIRNGDLYVNGKFPDKKFDLCLPYFVAADKVPMVTSIVDLYPDDVSFIQGPDKAEVLLSYKDCETLRKNNISFKRIIAPRDEKNELIARKYGKDWNHDHFGPLVIPAGRYFVLGDNRTRANDSRYMGLIPVSDFYGTVIVQ